MTPIPLRIKLGSLFFVTFLVVILFSIVYWQVGKLPYTDALYNAILTQTMNGKPIQTKTPQQKDRLQALVSIQSILAYFITSGMLIISIHSR